MTSTASASASADNGASIHSSPSKKIKENFDAPVYICIDASGSTQGNPDYWAKVHQVTSTTLVEYPNAQVIFWDTGAVVVQNNDAFEDMKGCRTRVCGGGTSPSCIFECIQVQSNSKPVLILITDGQVGEHDVKSCDHLMTSTRMVFSYVECYFISTGGIVNLSVSSPFTRSCKFKIINGDVVLAEGDTSIKIDFDKYLTDPELFIKEFNDLYKLVAVKTRGRKDDVLRNAVLDLQIRMKSLIAKQNNEKAFGHQSKKIITDLRNALKQGGNDDSAAIAIIRDCIAKLKEEKTTSIADDIEKKVNAILQVIDSANDFSFDVLKSNRVGRAAKVKTFEASDVNSSAKVGTSQYECPIMLDDAQPCLLIASGEEIFSSTPKHTLDSVMNMPLSILTSPHRIFADKLKEKIDHVIGIEALKLLVAEPYPRSPITRKQIAGALTFGQDPTHDKANNYTLSKIFFPDNKLVGPAELWLCAIYFTIVDHVPYLAKETKLLEAFRSYLIYRLQKYQCNITLSGKSLSPAFITPMDISIWYCVASARIADGHSRAGNRLFCFSSVAKYLERILDEVLCYAYDKAWTKHQIILYSALSWMVSCENKKKDWRKIIKAQYQASLILPNGYIVLMDGPAFAKNSSAYRLFPKFLEASLGDLIALSEFIGPNRKAQNVVIPSELTPINPTVSINFGYDPEWTYQTIMAMPVVKICPSTCRPYLADRGSEKVNNDLQEDLFGCEATKLLHHFNYFARFIMTQKRFPKSKWEFIEWLSERLQKSSKGFDTMPCQIVALVDQLYRSYESLYGSRFGKANVQEVRKKLIDSTSLKKRAEMEQS